LGAIAGSATSACESGGVRHRTTSTLARAVKSSGVHASRPCSRATRSAAAARAYDASRLPLLVRSERAVVDRDECRSLGKRESSVAPASASERCPALASGAGRSTRSLPPGTGSAFSWGWSGWSAPWVGLTNHVVPSWLSPHRRRRACSCRDGSGREGGPRHAPTATLAHPRRIVKCQALYTPSTLRASRNGRTVCPRFTPKRGA
jgi:hypothetical protein